MKVDLDNIKYVYFIGIGGIGMSAIARFFNSKGFQVAGYDKVKSPLTLALEKEGIEISYEDVKDSILSNYISKDSCLVIYTPAIPTSNIILQYYRCNDFKIFKRSEILGLIASSYKLVAVAGTHGKTTVSTMVAHLFKNSFLDCCAFLGGISKNFGSNLVLDNDSEWSVMEADEFDRSFLELFPDIAIITAMDADHLDIYGTEEELRKTFYRFISQIKEGGILIYKKGLPIINNQIEKYSYDIDDISADFYLSNVRIVDGTFEFDLHCPGRVICNLKLNYPGRVNLENCIAASASAVLAGIGDKELKKNLVSFSGVSRRFDIKYKSKDKVYIDDYAHHPDELRSIISSVRELYPEKRICGVFQPHLFSRTKDFQDGFIDSLNLLDELLLLDIYPAREMPIPGITSHIILDGMNIPAIICDKTDLLKKISLIQYDVLLTLGAGDIDRFVDDISNMLEKDVKKII